MTKLTKWLLFALILCGLSACGTSTGTGTANNPPANQNAQDQFLQDRGGTPAAGGQTPNMSQNPPTIGIVQKIQDNSISLLEPMSKQEKTITVASNATIRMQGPINVSDLASGDKVTAFGTLNNDQFQADIVQIGNSGVMGGPLTVGKPHEQSSNENMVGQPGSAPSLGQSLSGVIEKVDGDQFVVKSSEGKSVTVRLSAKGSIRKEKQIKLAELETGKLIVANGSDKNGSFEASDIEVLPAPGAP